MFIPVEPFLFLHWLPWCVLLTNHFLYFSILILNYLILLYVPREPLVPAVTGCSILIPYVVVCCTTSDSGPKKNVTGNKIIWIEIFYIFVLKKKKKMFAKFRKIYCKMILLCNRNNVHLLSTENLPSKFSGNQPGIFWRLNQNLVGTWAPNVSGVWKSSSLPHLEWKKNSPILLHQCSPVPR